jgi:hypothetical protein
VQDYKIVSTDGFIWFKAGANAWSDGWNDEAITKGQLDDEER